MSDLYDSLEEESDEIKRSCDSLDEFRVETPDFSKALSKSKSLHQYSFYLNERLSKDNLSTVSYPSSAFHNAPQNIRDRNFLPKIKERINVKGQESVHKIVVDNQILSRQGLQLNNDGSFTKSPRPEEAEELPFISREYRDLQFVKQKIITPTRKASYAKNKNKNLFSFADNPVDGISMNALISARKKKGSSEEILVSEGSVSSAHSKSNKRLSKQNLTDSMKEKLLHRSSKAGQPNNVAMGSLKKREINAQTSKIYLKNVAQENPNFFPQKSPRERLNSDAGNEAGVKPRSSDRKILRHRSDFMVNLNKQKLNYTDRLKLQSGYNPLHLRLGCLVNKVVTTDTTRSNFGDSMAEQLSGISSRIQSVENLMSEDEEKYYKKLMEVDQNRRRKLARSSRSEGPVDFDNLKDIAPSFNKTEKKMPNEVKTCGKTCKKSKSISKSLSLDIPIKPESSDKFSKKSSHLCLGGTSTTWSKAELALKAKTYGYMVNARNIFKLKAQAETKSSARNGKGKGEKNCPQHDTSTGGGVSKERIEKRVSLPDALPKVRHSSFRVLQELPKRKPSTDECFLATKPTLVIKDSRAHFFLPEVCNLNSRCAKMKSEMLENWSSYFKSPKR